MKIQFLIPTLLLGLVGIISSTQAADQSAETTSTATDGSDALPYQVVVKGRISRLRLRNMIEEVEEDFFAKFNELNADDAYDVYCYKYTPTMSHISKRICEPRFQIMERGLNAAEVAHILGCSGYCGDTAGVASSVLYSEEDLHRVVKPDYEVLQEKLEELTRTNPEFRQIGDVLAELKYRLENF